MISTKYSRLLQRGSHTILATMCSLTLPVTAIAQNAPAKRVIRGQEVVVSFPNQGGGLAARATARAHKLKVSRDVKLKKNLANGMFGVFSSAGTSAASAGTIVEVNEREISKICDSIRKSNPGVPLTCEANSIVESSKTPNDTQYGALYGMTKISAPAAWDITTGSSSIVVAVIDTGIDYTHPDLVDNIATNSGEIPNNGVDDDRNGYTDDYYGWDFNGSDNNPIDDHFHGTHCAGTIGAKGDNGQGVAGVNWTVKLLPIKVLSSGGSGTLASVASGMAYAVLRGAKIMSMSLGTNSYSSTLENAIISAKNSGVLVVAAAGNDGTNADSYPTYPAASAQDNVISVAASDSTDTLAYFSNWGATSVDLAAPGYSILSTTLSRSYGYASGTSMATPHVAGIAAMIRAVNPSLSYSQIKSILLTTVDPISSMNGKMVSGGRANLYKAVLKAQQGTSPTPAPTATPTPAPTGTATPTPTPTATPTPPDMEPPADGEPNDVSIDTERTRRKVFIFGEVFSFQDAPVANETVTLYCNKKAVGKKVTDDEGYYEFSFKRPARPITCFSEDSTGERSRRIRVR